MILLRISLFFLILLLLPDWYIYRFYVKYSAKRWKKVFWWIPSICLLLALLFFVCFHHSMQHAFSVYLITALCLAVPKMVFMVCDLLIYLCKKLMRCFIKAPAPLSFIRLYKFTRRRIPFVWSDFRKRVF